MYEYGRRLAGIPETGCPVGHSKADSPVLWGGTCHAVLLHTNAISWRPRGETQLGARQCPPRPDGQCVSICVRDSLRMRPMPWGALLETTDLRRRDEPRAGTQLLCLPLSRRQDSARRVTGATSSRPRARARSRPVVMCGSHC